MNRFFNILLCLLFVVYIDIFAQKQKKVLIIGIDGLIQTAITSENSPHLKNLMDNSLSYTNALADVPTWSATGWSGILTGVSVNKHNVTGNDFANNKLDQYPSFFKYLSAEVPTFRTASFVTWTEINNYINLPAYLTKSFSSSGSYEEKDRFTYENVINELSYPSAGCIFIQFDQVDHYGHDSGFSTTNPAYINSLKTVDGYVGEILGAIKSRSNYTNEDWLVIAVTDHGGTTAGAHGGVSYVERNAFIIVNNTAITPKLVNDLPEETTKTMDQTIQTIDFNGNVYGQIPASDDLNFGTDKSFTIEFRVRITSTNSDPVIIGNKDWNSGGNRGIAIVNNGGTLHVNVGDGNSPSQRQDIKTVDLNDNYWHHISVVVNRSTQQMTVYDAGVEKGSASISQVGNLTSGMNFCIAQDGTTSYNPDFKGNIAEIRIFKSALSPEAIKNYVEKSLDTQHPAYSDLIIYAKGNDASGSVFAGSLGKSDIQIKTRNSQTISWTEITSPIILGKTEDTKGAPHLYDIAPTVFSFLNLPISNYDWDGKSLVDFQQEPYTIEPKANDCLPAPTDLEAVIDNFENGFINFTNCLNSMEGAGFSIVDNPNSNSLNMSNKVLKITRTVANTNTWAGFWAPLNSDGYNRFDTDKYQYVSFKILQDLSGASARFKFENSDGGGSTNEIYPISAPSKTGEWELLTFDMKNNGAKGHYKIISIQPDVAANRPVHSVYIDDIILSTSIPTSISQGKMNANDIKVQINDQAASIFFNLPEAGKAQVSVFNTTGQLIDSKILNNAVAGENHVSSRIDSKGVYIVKVTSNENNLTAKFIK